MCVFFENRRRTFACLFVLILAIYLLFLRYKALQEIHKCRFYFKKNDKTHIPLYE